MRVELIPNWIISKQRLIFLVLLVSFLAKTPTTFFIVASLSKVYILIASTNAIVYSYFYNPIPLSVSFRSDAWTREK